MTPWIAALLIATAQLPPEVEQDGVHVSVEVIAHVYTWTVTNGTDDPIMRFEVQHSNCYNHIGPDGWETLKEGRWLRSWTTDRALAIQPGRSFTVQAQVSSGGAVLGAVPAIVGFGEGKTPVTLEVWGPARMPYASLLAVPATIVVVGLFHAMLCARRDRKTA